MLELQPFEPAGRLGQIMRLVEDCNAELIGMAIDAMIERLDARDGDPDLEDGGDDEPDGTGEGDVSFTEWHTRGRFKLYGEAEMPAGLGSRGNEDAEDDDPLEVTALEGKQWWDCSTVQSDDDEDDDDDCCPAGDDEVRSGTGPLNAGHFIHLDHLTIGSEDDAEDDRPPCYTVDQRRPLFVTPANDGPAWS